MITGWQVLRKQVKSPSSDRAECGGNNHDYVKQHVFRSCRELSLSEVRIGIFSKHDMIFVGS